MSRRDRLSGEGKEGLRGDGRKRASKRWKNTRVSGHRCDAQVSIGGGSGQE